jgi:MFS superfamily sulfate permease-like transporter
VAGLTLAAYAIPVSLAYAALAGLPPQMGLYCYLLAGLGYAVFGTSRHLAVGPTSAISLLLGATLAGLTHDPARQAAMASLVALIVAGIFAMAWLLRLSVLVNFKVDHVIQTVLHRASSVPDLKRVVCDLSNTLYADIAGARLLKRLHDELASRQIGFRVVGAHSDVRDRLRFERLEDWVGPINRHVSLADAAGLDAPKAAGPKA